MEKSQQPHISPWRPSHVLKDRKGMSKGPSGAEGGLPEGRQRATDGARRTPEPHDSVSPWPSRVGRPQIWSWFQYSVTLGFSSPISQTKELSRRRGPPPHYPRAPQAMCVSGTWVKPETTCHPNGAAAGQWSPRENWGPTVVRPSPFLRDSESPSFLINSSNFSILETNLSSFYIHHRGQRKHLGKARAKPQTHACQLEAPVLYWRALDDGHSFTKGLPPPAPLENQGALASPRLQEVLQQTGCPFLHLVFPKPLQRPNPLWQDSCDRLAELVLHGTHFGKRQTSIICLVPKCYVAVLFLVHPCF